MNILGAIMIAVCVISTMFCATGIIITMLTIGKDDNDQA